jgi:hypothetical protein
MDTCKIFICIAVLLITPFYSLASRQDDPNQPATDSLSKITKVNMPNDTNERVTKQHWEDIEGKKAVLRIYDNPQNDPCAFRTVSATVEHCEPVLDEIEVDSNAIFALVQQDQEDPVVRALILDTVYTSRNKSGIHLPCDNSRPLKKWTWTFRDALGNILPKSDFDVFLWDTEGNRIFLEHIDANGAFGPLRMQGSLEYLEYVFSNPDYGKACIKHICTSDATHEDYYIPLVHRESEAAGRAVAGRVFDSNRTPVENARIYCRYAYTPGGEGIYAKDWSDKIPVITDSQGYFSLYMPPGESESHPKGQLIPYNSAYLIRIEPPEKSVLLPYEGHLTNEQDVEIVLEKKSGKKHKLFFMIDANTPVEPNTLSYATIKIERPGKSSLNLTYEQLKGLEQLPYGRYSVEIIGWSMFFNPVEITANSPDTIIFNLPKPVTYKGRVVHGITGRPMVGVYVFIGGAAEDRSERLTQEHWGRLHKLVDEPNRSKDAIKILNGSYSVSTFTVTEYNGTYKISEIPGHQATGCIYAIEQDFMPCIIRKDNLRPEPGSTVEMKDIKLFPAAIVDADLCGPGNILVRPNWKFADKDIPKWATDMKNSSSSSKWNRTYEPNVTCNNWSIYVPSDVDIELYYEPCLGDESRYGTYHVGKVIRLSQGQTLHLGELVMPAIDSVMAKVSLRVLDSSGQPLAGVPVRIKGSLPHNTDANGTAYFYVDKSAKSFFQVLCEGPLHTEEPKMKYRLDFSLADSNNRSSDFEIKVGDEFVNCIYNK